MTIASYCQQPHGIPGSRAAHGDNAGARSSTGSSDSVAAAAADGVETGSAGRRSGFQSVAARGTADKFSALTGRSGCRVDSIANAVSDRLQAVAIDAAVELRPRPAGSGEGNEAVASTTCALRGNTISGSTDNVDSITTNRATAHLEAM